MKNNISIKDVSDNYLCRGLFNNFDIQWEKAENEFIYIKGINKKVIDFTSGILVNCLGYKNRYLSRELNKIFKKGIIHSYHYQTSIKKEYTKSLFEFTSDVIDQPKIYLTSSGTEATESCLKIMLRHGQKLSSNNNKVLSIEGNYHGRTMGSALMGNGGIFSEIWPNINDAFPKIKFPYIWEVGESEGEEFFLQQVNRLDPKILDSLCGIILETYQGWGACTYPKSYIKSVRNFCNERNILLAFDEMQSGFYRTGLKFGFQHYEVDADIICIGKGMGGGLPLSGLVGKSKVMDLSLPGELSSTHSCNPLSCAGGNAVIKIMESGKFKKLIYNNSLLFTTLGNQLKDKFQFIKEKSNFVGMVGALVFDLGNKEESIKAANIFCEKVLEEGVLVIKTGREAVKLSPPLLINKKSILKAFESLEKILININSNFY